MLQRGFQSLRRSLKQISLWWAVIQAAVISQRDCFLGWQRQLARGPVRSCQMAARRSHLINSRSLNVVQSRAEVLFINYCFPSLYRPEFEISCHKQQVSIQTLLELVLTMWNLKKKQPQNPWIKWISRHTQTKRFWGEFSLTYRQKLVLLLWQSKFWWFRTEQAHMVT